VRLPRLVNVCWDVDDARIHDPLREGLADDIESSANAIAGREW